MSRSLGIFVSSNQHLDKIIKLCSTAKEKGIKVTLFFTHRGTLLTQDPAFKELEGTAEMTLCKVSLERYGITKTLIPGIGEKDYATQAKHAEIIEECDRYIVF
jgi:sulfur relay (sulfurtransferase) complex TusBCD TusD component (DsrE family)